MPELPEVETTRRGIAPGITGRRVLAMDVRQWTLRWPIPAELPEQVTGQVVLGIERRGKYLLVRFEPGTMLVHLGMSGSLRLIDAAEPARRHDHVIWQLDNGLCLRLHDPRRFGSVLWTAEPAAHHPLLRALGPEPLSAAFSAQYLKRLTAHRRSAIKTTLMDARVVVGVGNIYASEALFLAGIHPARASGRIALSRYEDLVSAVRQVLEEAIAAGGTTLRDFVGGDGRPGYFAQQLRVYGRASQPCRSCAAPVRHLRQGQRSSYFCAHCQK